MKNPILRILISAILFSLLAGLVVSIIGFTRGWKTSTQFSDGFFWAGIIVLAIGFVNIMGRFSQGIDPRTQHSQSAVQLNADERYKIWENDILQGHKVLAFVGISGLLLLGLSGLALWVGRLFGI